MAKYYGYYTSTYEVWQRTIRDPFSFGPIRQDWAGYWSNEKNNWHPSDSYVSTGRPYSHHPIPEGKVKCEECHNPHGSDKETTRFKDPYDITNSKMYTTHPLALRNNYRFMDPSGYATNDPALRGAFFRNEYWPFIRLQARMVSGDGESSWTSGAGARKIGNRANFTCGDYRAYFCTDSKGDTWQQGHGSGHLGSMRKVIEGGHNPAWRLEQYATTSSSNFDAGGTWRPVNPPQNGNDVCFLCHKREQIIGVKSTNNQRTNGMARTNTKFLGHESVFDGAEISVNIAPFNAAVTNDYDVKGNIRNDAKNASPYSNSSRYNGEYHRFSCSRCHRPHSVANDKLLFTRCFSALVQGYANKPWGRQNYWYSGYNGGTTTGSDAGTGVRQCHPYSDAHGYGVLDLAGVRRSYGWNLYFRNTVKGTNNRFKGWRSRVMSYQIIGSFNMKLWQPYEIEVRDDIAYLADRNQGLVVINMEDPVVPEVIGMVPTVSTNPVNIALGVDNVYLTEYEDSIATINKIDIADPYNPLFKSSTEIALGGEIMDIKYDEPYVIAGVNDYTTKAPFLDEDTLSVISGTDIAGEIMKVFVGEGYTTVFAAGTTPTQTGKVHVYKNDPYTLFTPAGGVTFTSLTEENVSDVYHRINTAGKLEVYTAGNTNTTGVRWVTLTDAGVPSSVRTIYSGEQAQAVASREYDGKHFIYVIVYASSNSFKVYTESGGSSTLKKNVNLPYGRDIAIDSRYAYILRRQGDDGEGYIYVVNIKEDFMRPLKITSLVALGQDATEGLGIDNGMDSTNIDFINVIEGDGIDHAQTDLLLRWEASADTNHSHYEVYMIRGINLIENGEEFNLNLGGATSSIKSWQKSASNVSINRSTAAVANASAASMLVTVTGGTNPEDAYVVQNDAANNKFKFPIWEDRTYQVSIFARTKDLGTTRDITVMVDDDDDHTSTPFTISRLEASVIVGGPTVTIDDQWRHYLFTFTNSGDEKLACNLAILCGDSTQDFYLDSIKLLETLDDADAFKIDMTNIADKIPGKIKEYGTDMNDHYAEYLDAATGTKYVYYWNSYGDIYNDLTYIYAVTDVDDTGNTSYLSNTVTAILAIEDTTPPGALYDTFNMARGEGVKLEQVNGGFDLVFSWYDPDENGDVVDYEIYSTVLSDSSILDENIDWVTAPAQMDAIRDQDTQTVYQDGHTSILFNTRNPSPAYEYIDSSAAQGYSSDESETIRNGENLFIRTFGFWHSDEWWAYKVRSYDAAGLYTDSRVLRRKIVDPKPLEIDDLLLADLNPDSDTPTFEYHEGWPYNKSGTSMIMFEWSIPKDNGNLNGNWYPPEGEQPADIVANPYRNGSLMGYNIYRLKNEALMPEPIDIEYELVYTVPHGAKMEWEFTFYTDRPYESTYLGGGIEGRVRFVDTLPKDDDRTNAFVNNWYHYKVTSFDNASRGGEPGENPQESDKSVNSIATYMSRTITPPTGIDANARSNELGLDAWIVTGSEATISYANPGTRYPNEVYAHYMQAHSPRWRRSADESPFTTWTDINDIDITGFDVSYEGENIAYPSATSAKVTLKNKRPGNYTYAMFLRYTDTDAFGEITGTIPYTEIPIETHIKIKRSDDMYTDGTYRLFVGLFDSRGEGHLEKQYIINNYDGDDTIVLTFIRDGSYKIQAYIDVNGDGDKYPAWDTNMRDAGDIYSDRVTRTRGDAGAPMVINITDWP